MKKTLLSVTPLLIGVAILLTGQGLQGTLLPVRANMEGFSTAAIGLMGGAYFSGFTLGCLAAGLANGSFWALAPVFVFGYSGNVSLAATQTASNYYEEDE